MIRCPNCKMNYRKNTPDNCKFCKQDLTAEKKEEAIKEKLIKKNEVEIKEREEKIKQEHIKIDQEKREKSFANLKCRKCHSNNLEITNRNYFPEIFKKCNDCGNFDTLKYYNNINGKFGNLVKCALCGSTTTDISSQTGFPEWIHTDFEHIKNKTLCSKCDYEHHEELQEKDDVVHNKHLVIEYMFDDDELKYWEEGDVWDYDDTIVCDMENYGYKKAYKIALKEMKSKFPKTTKFIDIDDDK